MTNSTLENVLRYEEDVNQRMSQNLKRPKEHNPLKSLAIGAILLLLGYGSHGAYQHIKSRHPQVLPAPKYTFSEAVNKFENEVVQKDALSEHEVASLEILFDPNQREFKTEIYAADFERALGMYSRNPNSSFCIEGHADPLLYVMKLAKGAPAQELSRIEQAAKNLSLVRAKSVAENFIQYAKNKGIDIDPSGVIIIGHGITKPKYTNPKSEKEWRQNMRINFRVIWP